MNTISARQQAFRTHAPAQLAFQTRLQLLSSIKPIEKQPEARKPDVHEDASLAPFQSAWKKFYCSIFPEEAYANARKLLKNAQRPTPKDVEGFSIWLQMRQHEKYTDPDKVGLFLSAMVDAGKGRKFTVNTEAFEDHPNLLGYKNRKNLTVVGNIGNRGAERMLWGKMRIKGNAGDEICKEKFFGSVIVEGNAREDSGRDMRFGSLLVKGNTGTNTGCTRGGIVYVGGTCQGTAGTDAGALFVNGNLRRFGSIPLPNTSLVISCLAGYAASYIFTRDLTAATTALQLLSRVMESFFAGAAAVPALIYSHRYLRGKSFKWLSKG